MSNNIIDSIQVSGTVYQIQGSGGGNPTVELTQEQYDALVSAGTVSPTTYYIITDAEAVDMTNYYTKSETSGATQISTALNAKADTATTYTKTEVDTALGGKQATLVSGTNIKTINNESILGSGNIDIQGGGGVNVVQTTGTSTTDVMSQDAVTTAFNNKADKSTAGGGIQITTTNNIDVINLFNQNGASINGFYKVINCGRINNKKIVHQGSSTTSNFSLVETSAITTSITSASTDSQVPSAKAVYDALGQGGGAASSAITSGDTNAVAGGAVYSKFDEVEQVTAAALNALNDNFGGLKLVKLTQSEYDALSTKNSNTLYVIVN